MEIPEVRRRLRESIEHLRFTLQLCEEQRRRGGLYVFEHPVAETSWGTQMMTAMARLPGVEMINFDFCVLGMTTTDKRGSEVPAKKRTKVMTNSRHVAAALRCCQCPGLHRHEHLESESGRAKRCEEYTAAFSELIIKGLQREMADAEWIKNIEDKTSDEEPRTLPVPWRR
jgi:hypothetical protein